MVLAAHNQRIVNGGKPLDTPELNRTEVTTRAAVIVEKTRPVLKSFGLHNE